MSTDQIVRSESAVSLADFTAAELIVPALRTREFADVIRELSQMLQGETRVPDLLPFLEAVMNREFFRSTAMDYGFAFPHARLDRLGRLVFALGRSPEPLSWGTKPPQPVRLVFLIAVPATDASEYLLLVAALARLGKEDGLLARLHDTPDPAAMLAVLREVKLRSVPAKLG
jgi:mannitol/fructose-specific phosphotransferase system IIA component (Ntr-type)